MRFRREISPPGACDGAFALGTVPSLVALGWFAGSWKGKSGVSSFTWPARRSSFLHYEFRERLQPHGLAVLTYNGGAASDSASAASYDGQTQTISMSIGASGYSPNSFTLRAGEPTRWTVDATNASGCQMAIVSSSLGINKSLSTGENVIEFTAPIEPGTYQFSCPMGMYAGSLTLSHHKYGKIKDIDCGNALRFLRFAHRKRA